MMRMLVFAALLAVIVALARWLRRRGKPHSASPTAPPVALQAPADMPPPADEATAPVPHDPHALPQAIARFMALALGDGRHDPPAGTATPQLTPVHQAVVLKASHEISLIGSTPRYTPRQPSMLPRILGVLDDEEASLRALSRVLAEDPELTSDLLRTANSALYRTSGPPVESIERAAALLGTRGLRTLITAALVKPLATNDVEAGSRFGRLSWEHALYSASAAEAWAAQHQDCDPYSAHLAALLNGLGAMVTYRILMDQYRSHARLAPSHAALAQALATQAGIAAERIAASWGLSPRMQKALESQSSAAPADTGGELGEALRFGRMAGALVALCHHGRSTVEDAWSHLAAAGYGTAEAGRIWERLIRAYVSAR